MLGSSNIKKSIVFCVIFLLPVWGYSNNSGVAVKNAEIELSGDKYLLNADIDYQLSKKAIEALKNGVSLFWSYQIRVQEQRDFIWNNTLAEKSFRYRIQYHALLNMYRVRNETNGIVDNFSTLQAALDLMATLRDFSLIEKNKLSEKNQYIVGIKVIFERDSLPLPLRPIAYVNPQWYLSSEWYLCSIKK